jgi:hypothetical protein
MAICEGLFHIVLWCMLAILIHDEKGFRWDLDVDKAYMEAQQKRYQHLGQKYTIRQMRKVTEQKLEEYEFNKEVKKNTERNKNAIN